MSNVEDEGKKSGVGNKKQNVSATDDGKRGNNSNLLPDENPKNSPKCKEEENITGSAIIKIENFKTSETSQLFVNGSLLIEDGKRYGLVGLDSCGRTALLKHIANIPSGIDVLYWDEDIVDHMLPAEKAISKPSTRCNMLLAERDNLIVKQNNGNDTESVRNRLAELRKELLTIDPDNALAILYGLRIPDDENLNVKELPKHLRKRVSLARALYLEPELLILDEPTTELDLDGVFWLENYLQDWKKALIVVSQDRCFFDNVCKEIVHVNQQQLSYYKGNYSFFEKVFGEKQRRNLKKKEKRKGKKLRLKGDEVSRDKGAEAMMRSKSQNKSEVNDRREGTAPVKLLQKPKPEFLFCDPINDFKRNGFLQLRSIVFGYNKGELLFDYLSLGINHKSRYAILGFSNAGKSTLLKIEGEVYVQNGAIIGKFSQNDIDCLPSEESPLQYLCDEAADQETFRPKAVEKLIGLGLPNNRHSTKMEELTVNEKALVVLAKFCLYPHDVLLLDELTKYLSMDLIDALANAINEFKGAVLLVTNNLFLIRETESDLFVIDKRDLYELNTFEKYRRKVLKKLNEPIRGPFTFVKRTESKRDQSPIRLVSDSKIILDYIAQNDDVDPNIKNIGEYELIFKECTSDWNCYCPTLIGCMSSGRSKELCKKNMMYDIEGWIEMLIGDGEYVPGPP